MLFGLGNNRRVSAIGNKKLVCFAGAKNTKWNLFLTVFLFFFSLKVKRKQPKSYWVQYLSYWEALLLGPHTLVPNHCYDGPLFHKLSSPRYYQGPLLQKNTLYAVVIVKHKNSHKITEKTVIWETHRAMGRSPSLQQEERVRDLPYLN